MVLALKGKPVIAPVTTSSTKNSLEREVQVQGSMRQGKPTPARRSGSCPERGHQDSLVKDGRRALGKGGGSKPAALVLAKVSRPEANR